MALKYGVLNLTFSAIRFWIVLFLSLFRLIYKMDTRIVNLPFPKLLKAWIKVIKSALAGIRKP